MGIQDHASRWAMLVEHDEMLYGNWLTSILQASPAPAVNQMTALVSPPEAPLATMLMATGVESDDGVPQTVGLTAFPFAVAGARHRLIIREVTPWEGDMEGWLTVSVPACDTAFTFFDTHFVTNRQRYVVGAEADFILGALAYNLFVDDRSQVSMRGVSLAGAIMSTPVQDDEGGPDDHHFFAPALGPAEPVTMGPFSLTRVPITFMEPPTQDDIDRLLTLPLYVPDRAWRDERRPQAGDDLTGTLWLHGRLAE